MAYLCALLEQYPFSKLKPLSHKFEIIRSFLEDVVHVVPFESILYAIANGSHNTAMSCFQALKSCQLDLPISELMSVGLRLAFWRMSHGISGSTLQQLQGKEGFKTEHFLSYSLHGDSEEFSVTEFPRAPGQPVPLLPPPITEGMVTASIKKDDVEIFPVTKESMDAASYLHELNNNIMYILASDQTVLSGSCKLLCGLDIDTLYPTAISHDSQMQRFAALRSPLSILSCGREQLCALLEETQHAAVAATSHKGRKFNQKMLETVNNIRNKEVDTCANLLGAFMQQQEINIELELSKHVTSSTLDITAAASVGVWALFSLDYSRVQPLLERCKGKKLLVKIEDYIKGMSGEAPTDSRYAAKLQFMVQGMRKTVTCNNQYISYSLERQLVAVCTERKIDASIPLNNLLKKWSRLFRDNTLSLVREKDRPLIARWLKWALMIHNLREELAKYTAIGVVGLVNSGKSKLINTLFGIQVCTETMCCFY